MPGTKRLNVTDHYRFPNVNSEKEGWLCVCLRLTAFCVQILWRDQVSTLPPLYYMRVFCWLLCYDFREGLPRCYLPIFQAKGYWSYPRPARNTLCAMGAMGERTPWTRHRHTGGGTGRGARHHQPACSAPAVEIRRSRGAHSCPAVTYLK